MKAILQDRYGGPEALTLGDIDTPRIDESGVLVEVHAASVNALDWHATRGMPYLIRLSEGIRKPKHAVRGVDVAGRVAAAGSRVTRFRVGDDVFGGADGSFAEFAATTEDRLAPLPSGLDYAHAAALHVAGMTALQGLVNRAQLRAGQSVLINGAGGGVGTCAVQIAKWIGARVTAVTRTENVSMVTALGADEVIDHRKSDFARAGTRHDVIFDIGGNRSFADLRRAVAAKGTIVVVGAPAGRWLAPASRMMKAACLSPFVSARIIPFLSSNDSASLASLAGIAEAGSIRPVIDRVVDLAGAPEAVGYVGAGRARGKVVVIVRPSR